VTGGLLFCLGQIADRIGREKRHLAFGQSDAVEKGLPKSL
jgi:hypothetical protein